MRCDHEQVPALALITVVSSVDDVRVLAPFCSDQMDSISFLRRKFFGSRSRDNALRIPRHP